jgi:GMP synthase (glutamine-hydrolysing)
MQALAHQSGGKVVQSEEHEYGLTRLTVPEPNPLLHLGSQNVWMSHGDQVAALPEGYIGIAKTPNTPFAAMANYAQNRYGLQFHPEVHHSQYGEEILQNFILRICAAKTFLDFQKTSSKKVSNTSASKSAVVACFPLFLGGSILPSLLPWSKKQLASVSLRCSLTPV